MGGLVLPNVSARCCFSVQVATQRGLAEYGMAKPCKGAWQCEADGITPVLAFEEQARQEVCSEPTCLIGVTAAMNANLHTAKASKYMGALCDSATVSVVAGTEAGLMRANAEGFANVRRRRRRRPSETNSTNSSEKPAMCFPGEATVQVLGRGAVPMASLRIGEQVLTAQPEAGAPLKYEPVLDWIHVAKGMEASFVTIHHERGVLRASPGHLVFAASASNQHADLPAGFLKMGDIIFAASSTGVSLIPSKVLAVDRGAVSAGMYAPLTHSGTILVDGVLASNYATPSLAVRLPHWLAHAGLLPVRIYHSLGLASFFAATRFALLGDSATEGPEPDVVDVMHPYFSVLYHGLHMQKLLQSA
jgi:hypothetical protein